MLTIDEIATVAPATAAKMRELAALTDDDVNRMLAGPEFDRLLARHVSAEAVRKAGGPRPFSTDAHAAVDLWTAMTDEMGCGGHLYIGQDGWECGHWDDRLTRVTGYDGKALALCVCRFLLRDVKDYVLPMEDETLADYEDADEYERAGKPAPAGGGEAVTRTLAAWAVTTFGAAVVGIAVAQPRQPLPAAPAPPPVPPPPGVYTWDVPERGVYTVYISEVHDGDSVTACLFVPIKTRMAACNAPELNTPEGVKARDALKGLIGGKILNAEFHGREKYGRTLADFAITPDPAKPPMLVSQWLILNGHAKPWDGKGPRP